MLKEAIGPLKANPVTAALARTVGVRLTRTIEAFVFVATTGRSGTNTLQQLLDAVPGCASRHEPEPVMHEQVMRRYNEGDDSLMRWMFFERKLPHIYWTARHQRWYAETNHIFIKCFADAAVEALGPRLRVVQLARDPEAVAASFVHRRLAVYGSAEHRDYDYTLHPLAERNLLRPWDDPAVCRHFSHVYFEYIWQCYEIEARTRRFRRDHPHVPVYRIETPQLNDPESVRDLLEWIGMPFTDAVHQRIGTRVNTSPGPGSPPPLPDGVHRSDLESFHRICRELLDQV